MVAYLALWLATVCLVYVAYGLWAMGYRSLGEMDWNGDGFASPSEIWLALDTVKIPSRERPGCVVYVDAKGGSDLRATRCPAGR